MFRTKFEPQCASNYCILIHNGMPSIKVAVAGQARLINTYKCFKSKILTCCTSNV